ncbi:hypothetical protein [Mesobacillus harenae]|nr:hypothetical protein [Mesobacillus harenae]
MSKQQEQAKPQAEKRRPKGTVIEVNKPNYKVWAECIISQYVRYGGVK